MSDNKFEMPPDERRELIQEFLSEGNEYLVVLNEKLLGVEAAFKQGQTVSDDNINAMFRAAHTIKGTASFLDLKKTVELTHQAETLLDRIRRKEVLFSAIIIDVLFKTLDTVGALFLSLKDSGEEGDVETTECLHHIEDVLKGREAPIETLPSSLESVAVRDEYLPEFIVEAEENIQGLEQSLLSLEQNKADKDVIHTMFRLAHTLKGSAWAVNVVSIAKVAHHIENLLDAVRHGTALMDGSKMSPLFLGMDAIKGLLAELKKGNKEPGDVSEVCNALMGTLDTTSAGEVISMDETTMPVSLSQEQSSLIKESVAEGSEIFRIFLTIDKEIAMKSMKAMVIEERLRQRGKVIQIHPALALIKDAQTIDLTMGILFGSPANEKDIRSLLSIDGVAISQIERLDAKQLAAMGLNAQDKSSAVKETLNVKNTMSESSTLRIDSFKLDQLMNLSGELAILRARFGQLVRLCSEEATIQRGVANEVEDLICLQDSLLKGGESLRTGTKSSEVAQRISKTTQEFTSRLQQIKTRLAGSAIHARVHALDEMTGVLGKISADIQSGVMQARMVPVEAVFTRFKRIVRDISKEVGKEIMLKIEGEETELDKKIVDCLVEPLTHMVRNSIDHGIENQDLRRKSGKTEAGTILLKASHRGNSICIEVSDDGKGVDPEELVNVAVEKGFYTKEQADKFTVKEKLDLMFLPGFSTAKKVTDISGRGVGMDVVKNMITSMNGTIEIFTEKGKGTVFILRIPLTLAIIKALLATAGKGVYAFPIESVLEIVKFESAQISKVDGVLTVKLREHALSLIDLQGLIGAGHVRESEMNTKTVVVVTDGHQLLGLAVDQLIGEDEIVIKPLSEHFSRVKGITGVSILGDGKIALILDASAVIELAKGLN
ncbi:MAG: chemotaxis protein CheA [Candidatus Omnitrophota bacterium]